MARMESVKHVWSAWGLLVLVLLSFTLQVMLLVLAEFRRRVNSGVLRTVVWSAYLLADTSAIYVLGHLSVTSRSPDHQLMVFWAPFLLLHLGGQDNITAYAIEDTRLWLRHLQALAIQGVAAAYVLYESSIVGSRSLLRRAAILMFLVGSVKYAERVWALWRAGGTSSGSSYQTLAYRKDIRSIAMEMMGTGSSLLKRAHLLLDVPRDFLKGPLPKLNLLFRPSRLGMGDLYKVVEVQLSLMHDIFYTKTEAIHGCYGLLARTMSPVATAVALWLFHTDDKADRYHRVDVVVTYVLLVGALILETMWLLRAIFSSWTWAVLEKYWGIDIWAWAWAQKWSVSTDSRRYWRSCMEQHDLLELCWRSRASRGSRLAEYFGVEDLWNMQAYSWSRPVPELIKKLVADQVDQSKSIASEASEEHIFNSRGRTPLDRRGLYDGPHSRLRWSIDIELDESILVWHIATKIYLCSRRNMEAHTDEQAKGLVEAVKALSNYMLFLLAGRPYMLPPATSRNAYVELCYCLIHPELDYNSAEDLAGLLRAYGEALNDGSEFHRFPSAVRGRANKKTRCLKSNETLKRGSKLGATLMGPQPQGLLPADVLGLLAQVWVEMLCYAGHRCSGFYHAKQLSNGGELITIAAILAHYVSKAVREGFGAMRTDGRAIGAETTISFASGLWGCGHSCLRGSSSKS